jgi:hypothetical protein
LETRDSGEYHYVKGQLRRRKKQVSIRGLNKDHNNRLMIQRMERLHRKGFVFRTHTLKKIERLLQEDGEAEEAVRVARLH